MMVGIPSSNGQMIDQLIEYLTIRMNKKAVLKDSTIYPSKIIVSPVVSYAPETSLALGFGAKYLFKFRKSGDETRTSNMPIALQYTLNSQFIFYSGYEIFFNQERYMLTGNLVFQNFPRLFYGVGRNTPDSNEEEYGVTQVLVEPILLKHTPVRYLFAGGGIRYNRFAGIEAIEDGLLENTETPGALGSRAVGVQLAVVFDNRENILNSNNGWFIQATYGFYDQSLGSSHHFTLTRFDIRKYLKPLKNRNDVLAFQLVSHFSQNAPLAEKAMLGSDEIMRGYYEGRYISNHLVAGQVEYRRKIKGRFGAIAFVGLGDVVNELNDFKLSQFRGSYGFGIRFLLDERENLNLRFDWGFGNGTNNYYLNIAEAF